MQAQIESKLNITAKYTKSEISIFTITMMKLLGFFFFFFNTMENASDKADGGDGISGKTDNSGLDGHPSKPFQIDAQMDKGQEAM